MHTCRPRPSLAARHRRRRSAGAKPAKKAARRKGAPARDGKASDMKQVALRYPPKKVLPRVEALIPHIQAENELVRISQSKVLLMALLEGLAVLEKHYQLEPEKG